MGDDKKGKKDDSGCSLGTFELKISQKKEEKKPEKKGNLDWKVVATLAATAGIGIQVAGSLSSGGPSIEADVEGDSPSIASSGLNSDDTTIPFSASLPPNDTSTVLVPSEPSLFTESSLQFLSLSTLESVQTLPSAIQDAIANQNFEAIALLFTEGDYWVGDVKATLDMSTIAASDSLILQRMEEAIATGCVSYPSTDTSASNEVLYWICPGIADLASSTSLVASNTVLIHGAEVNIRRQASVDSDVMAVLSYQILPIHQPALDALSEDERFELDIGSGWCPVDLTEGDIGYVASEFCRPIQQPHALLRLLNGKWQVTIATP